LTALANVLVPNSGPAAVNAASSFGYTVTVANQGPSSAANVVVRDTLPSNATFVSATDGGVESGGVVTWPAIASLADGANVSHTVTVTAPGTGKLRDGDSASSSTSDPVASNNDGSDPSSRVTTSGTEIAEVAVTLAGPRAVNAASSFSYTVTVANQGPSDAANVAVRDTLPSNATFASATDGGVESGGVVTWPAIASLANGANVSHTVTVTAP